MIKGVSQILITIFSFSFISCNLTSLKTSTKPPIDSSVQTKNNAVKVDSITVHFNNINFILPRNELIFKNTLSKPKNIFIDEFSYLNDIKEKLFKYITYEDFQNMKRQERRNFTYKTNSITDKTLISSDTLDKLPSKENSFYNNFWNLYEEKFHEHGYNEIGRPLFTINNKYFIIFLGYYCGARCGRENILIYENINGVYKYKDNLFSIIF